MKFLMTSGPTQEPIDSVRYITNFSSGKTGARLADIFSRHHHEVYFLSGVGAAKPTEKCHVIEFRTFSDLDSSLQNILREDSFDFIIHLAAVGDYSVKEIKQGDKSYQDHRKIDSGDGDLTVTLKKNHKIIHSLHSYSKNSDLKIIGFKLTDSLEESVRLKAVQTLFSHDGVSLVVHNDLTDIDEKQGHHRFRILEPQLNATFCETVDVLGERLLEKMERTL
jgi:phosphopantothenoylcysteine decarboxylase / phosphopantothenate---cysteine ligase